MPTFPGVINNLRAHFLKESHANVITRSQDLTQRCGPKAKLSFQSPPPADCITSSPISSMASDLNLGLIEATESGNAAQVQRLIDAGAKPNDARKMVSLVGIKTEGDHFDVSTVSDTIQAESVLALAILHGDVDVVRVLLEHGRVDPNKRIEWRIAHTFKNGHYRPETWAMQRWATTYAFPNALLLAIGKGGTWTEHGTNRRSGEAIVGRENGEMALSINLKGGHVKLTYGKSADDFRTWFAYTPKVEIVELLLRFGAKITQAKLNAAGKNPDPAFREALERHWRNLVDTVEVQKLEIHRLHERIGVLESRVVAGEEIRLGLRSKTDGLVAMFKDLSSKSPGFSAKSERLRNRNAELTFLLSSRGL
ncbi:hypothetical protein M427DRAFT_391006 [Gonapodya prolifera JEL478]|uniref:Ankyrin n=1 Tax=Gonapodya prolifera (strain JEL478) TaxID=1344416 RepID=A0A139A8D3_GONPJ|nr:hypothetical protein M427DRAFT_391006 [Gonapodya prolifera JEL478]|eukprot:KXS12705.1 hypothetical protein M427DRAFT_391006 [Gonapodya prolifera JEL478]